MEIVDQRAHPIFQRPSNVSVGGAVAEARAAQHFGMVYDPSGTHPNAWQRLVRGTRALLTAFVRVEQYTSAMNEYDSVPRKPR